MQCLPSLVRSWPPHSQGSKGKDLTSQREEAQAAHAQKMLEAKILHLEKKTEWEWGGTNGGDKWGMATHQQC